MGFGYHYDCKKCGKKFSVALGNGMSFSWVYKNTIQDIRNGKYGERWKALLDAEPNTAVDIGRYFYLCGHCGNWENEKKLDLYVPRDPEAVRGKQAGDKTAENLGYVPYLMGRGLQRDYRLLGTYIHKCPKCGERMRRIENSEELRRELSLLACPDCGEPAEGKTMLWD